jgi:hypothetical protein
MAGGYHGTVKTVLTWAKCPLTADCRPEIVSLASRIIEKINSMIDPYAPDTIEGVRKVLGGLDHTIKVEIGPGTPLAAKTVWDLQARGTWPPGLRLIVPSGPEERIVKVERRR